MNVRKLCSLACLVALGWGSESTVDGADAEPQVFPGPRLPTTPLHESGTVSFSQAAFFAWVPPTRCDTEGLYFVTLPVAPARAARKEPEQPAPLLTPSDILFVSADGKKTTLFSPRAAPPFADAEEVRTVTTALDSSGTLHSLNWVVQGKLDHQYIVSFDKRGQYRSRLEVDHAELIVEKMDIFGSGEYLLRGVWRRPDGALAKRIVVMSANGGAYHDVSGLPMAELEDPDVGPAFSSDQIVRGGDGQIYFASPADNAIYVIDPLGASQELFGLSPVPRKRKLMGLEADGQRLVTVYHEQLDATQGRFFLIVYDVVLGEQVAAYEPVSAPPVCYQYAGQRDSFTLLKDAKYLVTMRP